jgi:hypothetical protein
MMHPPSREGSTAAGVGSGCIVSRFARWALLVGSAVAIGGAYAQPASAEAQAAAAPPSAASAAEPMHRSLRAPLPQMDALPPPTVPEVFTGYPDAPSFSVVPRKPELPLHPCSMCHNLQKLNTTVRQFKVAPPPEGAPHAGVLRHGKGRIWCLDCHFAKDREWLRTLNDKKLDFNDSPLQCGQCHSTRYRDWVFGAHGKRVAGWSGERQLYACTHCHDPHVPQIPLRAAAKPPPLRAALMPMAMPRESGPLPWERTPQGPLDGPQAKP